MQQGSSRYALRRPLSVRHWHALGALVFGLALSAAGCGTDWDEHDGAPAESDQERDDEVGDEDEDVATVSLEGRSASVCAGKPIDRAVKCAVAKGARVLSFYRSPAEQERVRRQNRCTNRCTGMAGCVRPTANCTSSPHTRCLAVDLVADGAPVSRAALRACGLGKTTSPHANHYDLLR
jgi:hypothetical protein